MNFFSFFSVPKVYNGFNCFLVFKFEDQLGPPFHRFLSNAYVTIYQVRMQVFENYPAFKFPKLTFSVDPEITTDPDWFIARL